MYLHTHAQQRNLDSASMSRQKATFPPKFFTPLTAVKYPAVQQDLGCRFCRLYGSQQTETLSPAVLLKCYCPGPLPSSIRHAWFIAWAAGPDGKTQWHAHTHTHTHNQKQMNLISKTTAAYNWPCEGKIELYSLKKKIVMPKNNLGMVWK